ncbi:putative polysaccharide biosynthesis protein [Ornithinibacillus halophilus]|uniref:Membrane protein involved in the export of O-antigen and teichoic acid n=1 Tax=Ornithinibacillus halophilus TaxID=930117 RepID=A0A1M5EN87_9BACI|nr:polysaccharide biosynthesis protein [Ornithinibacillus halophilus]SHF80646.1 Membrane protein involved in the export of O-antigen and teichoic acid [Ornithinibacillus halophilus]
MSKSTMVRGALLLTSATFLTKFLGMIYVIPFNAMIGEEGGALFQYAYIPYSILITLSTIGLPSAVSKFVSKYNSLEDYYTGLRMFKVGMKIMAVTGILAFLILFFGAESLAKIMLADADIVNNSVEDVTMVIRMVSIALIIIPSMSIFRGFFQGNESMGPTAVSQVVEQIVRIIFLLTAVFLIINVFNGTIATAVGFATFAAFIGAIASYTVLLYFWRKRKPYIDKKIAQQTRTSDLTTKDLATELLSYAGPFVFFAIAIPLVQLVDTVTFNRAMIKIGQGDVTEMMLGTINFTSHKLVIMPATLASGLSIALLPVITSSFTKQNGQALKDQINQAIQIIIVLVIPASLGITLLSDEVYGSLFGMGKLDTTSSILAWYAPVAVLFALSSVTAIIMQGINQQNTAVIHLFIGILAKVLLNTQFIYMFGAKGSIYATALAFAIPVLLNLWKIKKTVDLPIKPLIKRTMLVGIFVTFMAIAIWIIKFVLGLLVAYEESRFGLSIMLVLGVMFGGLTYLWFAYKSTLLERVLGERVRVLERIFGK